MKFRIANNNENVTVTNEREEDGIIYADVNLNLEKEAIPESFKVLFSIPSADCYSVWSPSLRYERFLNPNWRKQKTASRLASWMPIHQVVSHRSKNKITIAVSDAKTPITIGTGASEENADIDCEIEFFTVKVAPLKNYTATIRIDLRDIPYYDCIYDVVNWWEKTCGYTPAYVPDSAKMPMNSLWYSYHQALDVEDILKECALSKPLGMDTVIIDDGWQTSDSNRGYAYCGDWEVAKTKVPDMAEFVEKIHNTGMKVMLWYSVPFVGVKSKNFEKFKDYLLDETGKAGSYYCLDPRYKIVRDFLIDIYKNAVKDWNLDGLKLDFIDNFALRGKSLEYDERRDYQSLEDAIDVLMTDITNELRKINSEILLEFRQSYIGPAIRKYGNMLRVGDCPNDALKNRNDVVNLRLTSGSTAVHSDMLEWHVEDSAESAAMQFVCSIYSVPQISMKIAELPEEHKKMLAFYLDFWRKNREVLIEGKLKAENPESDYSIVSSEKDGKIIYTCHTDTIVKCNGFNEVTAINASRGDTLLIKGAEGKKYSVVNCLGETLSGGVIDADIAEITVPLSGMIKL